MSDTPRVDVCESYGESFTSMRNLAAQLERELAKAQADAARLDWLQSTTDPEHGWYVDESGAPIMRGELEGLWSKTLRGAIDAAMKDKNAKPDV